MSNIVIKAENLGKKYTIGHQAGNGRYVALRDVLMQNARGLWHKTKDLVQGKPIILGDTLEEVWALKDVSFEIQRGEAVGIIGRNGAGKSTLLKILSRITEPSTGRVTIKGRVASLLEVGTGFHPELTGRENIYLNGAILGMARAEIKSKFDEIVAFAEVENFLDTPVKRYSSGMYVRLAFAVAAHLETEILVVDEVLAVGDVEFQKKCLGKMGEVANEGRTVLFVSHNMAAISTLCRSAIVLNGGKQVFCGLAADSVSFYSKQGQATEAQRTWEMDDASVSNSYFHLQNLRVYNQAGQSVSVLSSEEPFELEAIYSNLVDGTRINVVMVLYNQVGVCVLSTINNHEKGWHGIPLSLGTYQSRCTIPANLLSPGLYYLTVILTREGYLDGLKVDEGIQFSIHEQGELRGDYFGGWSGVIRPWLDWQTSKVSDQETK